MSIEEIHNKSAPYWAGLLIILNITGLLTNWLDLGHFWKGYVLDIVGPAWVYILIRGLYTKYSTNAWLKFFTPLRTFLILLFAAYIIEGMQYFKMYNATYDTLDLVAYTSLLLLVYLIEIYSKKKLIRN